MVSIKYSCFSFLLLLSTFIYGDENRTKLAGLKDALYGFEYLQDSTRTKVWWFHGETVTTRAGITADLEAFHKQGVGGVVYYDQTHGNCEGAFEAFSPEWWEMLVFASQEAKRLGLTFETHISNGYVAGGPWITPALGMQRLTSVETIVDGGKDLEFSLPVPEARSDYYKDVAILAFPYQREIHDDSRVLKPVITCNKADIDAKACFSSSKQLSVIPVQKPGESVYMTLDFGKQFTARCITYSMAPRGKAATDAMNVPGPPTEEFVGTGFRVLLNLGELEVSDDGLTFKKVCDLKPVYLSLGGWKQKTLSFPAVTGRYFRLNLHDWYEKKDRKPHLELGQVVLSSRACIDQWEEKAALTSAYIENDFTPSYQKNEIIDPDRIVDLTEQTDSLGTVRWKAPAGKWVVVRFAHVPTGGRTKHGRKNMIGLECDKLSAVAAEAHWNHYLKHIADSIEAHGGHLDGVVVDSHEAGSQNWTSGFENDFLRLRGYDLRKYLPTLAGYVVESREVSDGFLYDMRRTIADLTVEKYFGTFQRLCKERNLILTSQDFGALCMAGDPILAKGKVQKPQSEFWGHHPDGNYDIKECSSAAHMYGKPIASAEAFSDVKFSQSLAELKQLADYAYAFGINEFVGCASSHQPWLDKLPGSTGGGRHYALNRTNTFWEYSRDFWDYQNRSSFLMRQGMSVIDLCLYLGDNAPVRILTHRLPVIPAGFDFDAFSTDALFTRMEVKEGRIVLPDGVSYQMMVLPRNGEITLEALRKIASLVQAGASVYGTRPQRSGTLHDLEHMVEYEELVNMMWGRNNTPQGCSHYGKGTVYWGMSLTDAVSKAGMMPDVTVPEKRKFYYAHRTLWDGEIYFLDNHEDTPLAHTFIFHTSKRYAELWNPVTGKRYSLQSTLTADGRISVPLQMAARESYFVIFSDAQSTSQLPVKEWNMQEKKTFIQGDWTVDFSEKLGGPGKVVFTALTDWTSHKDERIKYYSGTAVYRHNLMMDDKRSESRYLLRFAKLASIARIVLNGREVGTVWCSPWEIDITEALETGENKLEIYVANSLMNRMIGDSMLPEDQRITYSATSIATPGMSLIPSGIIGSVQLVRQMSASNSSDK